LKTAGVFTYNPMVCEIFTVVTEAQSGMSRIVSVPDDEENNASFKPLTALQAQALREAHPALSPWWVVLGQALVGLLVALVTWGLTGQHNLAWSAGYGALAVIIPAALFARGLTSRMSRASPGAAVFGFFLWEMVKIALTIAMLFAAPRLIANLSWPIMLVGLVVTMKVYWIALLFNREGKPNTQTTGNE
jgi:ATP synthase protein I